MRNISEKNSITLLGEALLFSETHAGNEVMWKNALELDGLHMAI